MFPALIFALSLLVAGILTPAQAQPLQPEDAFALSVSQDGDGALVLTWRIADGYYLYRSNFAAEADGQSLPLSLPAGETYEDPYFGTGQIYRQDVTARLDAQGQPVTLHWQGCQQDGICYAPQSVRLDVDGVVLAEADAGGGGWNPQAAEAGAAGGAVAEGSGAGTVPGLTLAQDQGVVQGLAARGGGALVIAGFLGFGVLLAFTPCVFPMFPIVAGMLAGQGESLTARRGLMLTGAYVLAMAGAFGLLGVAAAWSGANLQMVLQSPAAIAVIAALFVALALSMFGFYELQLPQAMQTRLGRIGGRRGSVGGALILGFTSALIVGLA